MNILFKVREFVWVIVSEIEDWVYPYRTRLTEEEKYEHGMKDPMTGEITMIENLLQADNERIQRLQDEMIHIQNRVYEIEENLKSINTYSKKSNQINPNSSSNSKNETLRGNVVIEFPLAWTPHSSRNSSRRISSYTLAHIMPS